MISWVVFKSWLGPGHILQLFIETVDKRSQKIWAGALKVAILLSTDWTGSCEDHVAQWNINDFNISDLEAGNLNIAHYCSGRQKHIWFCGLIQMDWLCGLHLQK